MGPSAWSGEAVGATRTRRDRGPRGDGTVSLERRGSGRDADATGPWAARGWDRQPGAARQWARRGRDGTGGREGMGPSAWSGEAVGATRTRRDRGPRGDGTVSLERRGSG